MPVVIQPGAQNTSKAMVLWDNFLSDGVIYGQFGVAPNYPVINAIKDESTWSAWRTTANPSNRGDFKVDLGEVKTFSALGVSSHTLGSDGVTIQLFVSNNGTTFGGAMASYSPITDNDFILLFKNYTYRYVLIRISGGPSSVGVLSLGSPLVFPHAPVDSYVPLHHSRRYEKLYNDSLKGHFLGNRVMSAGAETEVDMGFLDRNWLELNIRGFEKHYNQGRTFFYAGCPSRYPDDMGYCRSANSDESLAIEFIEGDRLSSLSFGVRSFVGA